MNNVRHTQDLHRLKADKILALRTRSENKPQSNQKAMQLVPTIGNEISHFSNGPHAGQVLCPGVAG